MTITATPWRSWGNPCSSGVIGAILTCTGLTGLLLPLTVSRSKQTTRNPSRFLFLLPRLEVYAGSDKALYISVHEQSGKEDATSYQASSANLLSLVQPGLHRNHGCTMPLTAGMLGLADRCSGYGPHYEHCIISILDLTGHCPAHHTHPSVTFTAPR